jgi:hypothetical protein
MMLGDDRAVHATYAMGEQVWPRALEDKRAPQNTNVVPAEVGTHGFRLPPE